MYFSSNSSNLINFGRGKSKKKLFPNDYCYCHNLVYIFKTIIVNINLSLFCNCRSGLDYASLHSRGGTRPPLPAIRALGSALYDNPGTLLNGHLRQTHQQLQQHRLNINNLKSSHLSSHEHSDSGLSAESHEYSPYSSERLTMFQTSSVIGSGWTNDTATIREDDESQEPLHVSSPVHKAATSKDATDTSVNTTQQQSMQQTSANNGVQEIAHEMSTEL
ncbi:hypothetical protein C0J52_27538 [Blattella germanica]|nr:hypothetical protein C0J52_27538 [Blattella germanica]